jgi:hypothetical protein
VVAAEVGDEAAGKYVASAFGSKRKILKLMVLAQIALATPDKLKKQYKKPIPIGERVPVPVPVPIPVPVPEVPLNPAAAALVAALAAAQAVIDAKEEAETNEEIQEAFQSQCKVHRIIADICSAPTDATATRKVIFVKYDFEANKYKTLLGERGIDAEIIRGSTTQKARAEILEKAPSVLILNILCAACGLNLTNYSEIYYSCNTWNNMEQDQSEARVYRIGQTREVVIHKYNIIGSFDNYMNKLKEEKAKAQFAGEDNEA